MALTDRFAAIGNAIRAKNGQSKKYKLSEMPEAIRTLPTGTGSTPRLQTKVVVPSSDGSDVVADDAFDGLAKVTVEGDSDLRAENIRSGVNIFGVTGAFSGAAPRLQTKSVTPSNSEQRVQADSGFDGLMQVTVDGDSDLAAANIKSGVNIFGVTGTYSGNTPRTQTKTVTPKASSQTIKPDSGYDGLSQVTVNGDSDLVAANIKSGVEIFGVTGTYSGAGVRLQSKSVTPSESAQSVSPDAGYDGLSKVDVSAVSSTYVGSGVTKKAAATYTPKKSAQTIAAGQYLDGAQTIAAIPDSYIIPSGTKSITTNGTQDVTAYASVDVNVPTSSTPQRATGTFTTGTDGSATVNLGFVPDIVLIRGNVFQFPGYSIQAECDLTFWFSEMADSSGHLSCAVNWIDSQEYGYIIGEVRRTANGFEVWEMYTYDANWAFSMVKRQTFNYIAIKYQ